MTKNEYVRNIGHAHKMMDKGIDKSEIKNDLIRRGVNEDDIDEIFGIILRSGVNKLKKYYGKEAIEELLNK